MANASLFLDTRRPLADETFRVRIRITENRSTRYFALPYSYDKSTYKKIIEGKYLTTTESKKAHKEIIAALRKAQNIIGDLIPFSFASFKLRYTSIGDRSDIVNLLNTRAKELKEENKFSSSNLYQQAANLFSKYAQEKNKETSLKINNLTPKELHAFELWAKKSYSLTTIGMYMVRTKAIFNSLIRSGELNNTNYPFGKKEHGLYPIPKAANAKRPLSLEEIMLIYNYIPKTETQLFAKDMFLFSYLASGMNMYDIFKLKHSNFDKDLFTFIRKKTEHKKSDKIVVNLNEDLIGIIKRHEIHVLGNDYIFKILKPGMSPLEENNAVRIAITNINQALKIIAKKLGIPTSISTYYARHSFSNILMQSEAPLAFISKKLGHSNLSTTQNYLDQFTKDSEEKYTSNLLKKSN
ncbi:tyrosine-type recombinase/integrase [Pedobacter panaciterrae]|uniref:tyrosine-type recombinase/integrase n=1 Tax=Pedobacter panaciterrae TaxID=363849 RepID=UPI0025948086|nr:tyrosine-type recombinase/integrase [uncultured Pedobacter sp.]